jgi:maleate isomerase
LTVNRNCATFPLYLQHKIDIYNLPIFNKEVIMYGWRARLGVLVPSKIMAIEPEFESMIPEGVSCHYHRFTFRGATKGEEAAERLKKAEQFIPDAAEMITHVGPSVIGITGTGVSFIGGFGYDQKLIDKVKSRVGDLPVTTTSTAMIEALKTLGIKKVSMAMPYLERVAKTALKFTQDSGIEVLNAKWMNKNSVEIPRATKEELFNLVREVDEPESQAMLIPCVDLHTIGVIEELESDLRKPVITSNQAALWHMLRLAGVNDQYFGFGELFSEY